jgi:protocatechuate 3,4-dioxygenase alpha subunit
LYFADDPRLASDPVLAIVQAGRRSTLIAKRAGSSAYIFPIRLQGPQETVFFDV